MAVSNSYFLNGTSLSSSTAVFTDANMLTKAADGYYSDGFIVREQVDGVLLPQQPCPECAVPCGSSITGSGGSGIYMINMNLGNTNNSVGAVVIRFDPFSVPDGIRVEFNGQVYNKLSSPVDGVHQSTNANNFTFVGASNADCGISGSTYPSLPEFLYNGTSFVATGQTASLTVSPGDVSLGANPGICVMVIPKTTPEPSTLNIKITGPCSGTAWGFNALCPAMLPSFAASTQSATSELACDKALTQTLYFVNLSQNPPAPGLYVYDYVFLDAYGQTPAADGYYKTNFATGGNNVIRIINGVVTQLITCGSGPTPPNCRIYSANTESTGVVTYVDCTSGLTSVPLGGSDPPSFTFCAQEGSVVSNGDVIISLDGTCSAPQVDCNAFEVTTTTSGGASYIDCDGFFQTVQVGTGANSNSYQFCARVGTVQVSGNAQVTNIGPCVL